MICLLYLDSKFEEIGRDPKRIAQASQKQEQPCTETDVQYLRIYIRTLRQKIEAAPERPEHILTEQGVGYRLRAAD